MINCQYFNISMSYEFFFIEKIGDTQMIKYVSSMFNLI